MKKFLVFFILAGSLFSQPYYKSSELPEYNYVPPLVCEVEIPSGIVNGLFIPTHKKLVVVKPPEYTLVRKQQEKPKTEKKLLEEFLTPEKKVIKTGKKEEVLRKKKIIIEETIPEELNRPISISFSDVPLRIALNQLAMLYNLKFVVSRDVPDLKVSCFAKDIPLSSVLDDLTTQVKATYSYKKGKIFVYVFGTKIFHLFIPNITHSFTSSINTSGYTGFGGVETTGTSDTSSTTIGGITASSSQEAGPNSEVRIEVGETKIYEEIEKNLKSILSEKGKYGINKTTGIITITDYADNLKEAERFLEAINKEFSKQVSLKIRIAEVELSDKYQAGINWDYLTSRVSASSGFSLVSSGNTLIFKSNKSSSPGIADKGVQFILQALKEFGRVNIISQPFLTVLNTQPASIQVGAVKNYISSVAQETSDVGIISSVGTSQVAEGLTLSLINKITNDGKVYLSLIPTLKEVKEIRKIPTGGGGEIEAPDVDIRALETSVVVKPGDTIILGGLMKEREKKNEQQTPILGKIPLLNFFFKHKIKEIEKKELVIMLTVEKVIENEI